MDYIEKLKDLFAEIMDLDKDEISNSLNMDNCDNWDSIHQLALLTTIQEEFNITLNPDEMLNMISYSELLKVIESHMA